MKKRFQTFFAITFSLAIFAAISVLGACTARERSAANAEGTAVTAGTEGMEDADMAQIFAAAGMNLLSRPISARSFSLEVVRPLSAAGGDTLSLSDLRGDVVLLYFWATWCSVCREGMPFIESLHSRFKDDGLKIIGVNVRESAEAVNAFMRENGFTFPSVLDGDGRLGTAYGVQAIPTNFLIDREGKIIARLVGRINSNNPNVYAAFEELLR